MDRENLTKEFNALIEQRRKALVEEEKCKASLVKINHYGALLKQKEVARILSVAFFLPGILLLGCGICASTTVGTILFYGTGITLSLIGVKNILRLGRLLDAMKEYPEFKGYKKEDIEREEEICLLEKRRAHDLSLEMDVKIRQQKEDLRKCGCSKIPSQKIIQFPTDILEYRRDSEKRKALLKKRK